MAKGFMCVVALKRTDEHGKICNQWRKFSSSNVTMWLLVGGGGVGVLGEWGEVIVICPQKKSPINLFSLISNPWCLQLENMSTNKKNSSSF